MNQTIKELVRLNIKPNFAALGRENMDMIIEPLKLDIMKN